MELVIGLMIYLQPLQGKSVWPLMW